MFLPLREDDVADKRLKPGAKNAAGGVIGGAGVASQQGTTLGCSRYNSK